MSENTLVGTQATDATDDITENQAPATKTYTQREVDDMMARMKNSLQKKLLKPYEDLGDPEELRTLRVEAEKRQQQEQLKRGEFEKTLQEIVAKKDAEIQKREQKIREYEINTPLLSAAAKHGAVNAEQVKALLASQVRLNEGGEVEVVDTNGSVRYTDKGSALGVEDLVREFLDKNPHFKLATPANTNTKSNISSGSSNKVDISKLDMNRKEDREVYRQYRKQAGLA